MPLSPGTRLGPYEIVAPIGAGGMGDVYKARDTRLNREVALKVARQQFTDSYLQEAQLIAALNHSNICALYDIGPDYLVMELIEGAPLAGPLAGEEARRLAIQIAAAVEEAHAKQILHRDLKPGNILVTVKGAAKLLDFGLAKSVADTDVTQSVAVYGTPAYMSPEQAEAKSLDVRSDIFSFGAVLYEMLTGRRPFDTLAALLRDDPPAIDSPLGQIAVRCLAKRPEARFQSMTEVREALERSTAKTVSLQPSIAVLPFANMSADKENEYFSDGLAEEILNLLAKISGLKVIARTSSFAFRGKEEDITRIAEVLRVQHILEGSVRKAGNRIRIAAQLIQASDGAHIWSERYDRELTDVFAIQDEIGQAIAEALKLRLVPRVQPGNIEAWQHCLKGEYYRLKYTPEGLAKAKEHFEQAIAIDPNYAHAQERLAGYYYALAFVNNSRLRELAVLARAGAEKALALEPENARSHSLLAVLASVADYDWKTAAEHHRRALAAGGNLPAVLYTYATYCLLPFERTAEAAEQARLALLGDPLSMIMHLGLAFALCFGGRYDESIACSQKALEIDPNCYYMWESLSMAQLDAGRYEDAIVSAKRGVELAPWYGVALGVLASACHCSGDREGAAEWAQKLAAVDPGSVGMAQYYATIGDVGAMFAALAGAFEKRDVLLVFIRCWKSFDPYREDPRYRQLLQRMNLA